MEYLQSIEDHGCRLMVSLFKGTQSDSLESLGQCTVKKSSHCKEANVKPEGLPPTTSAAKFHCRKTYLQVMQWMSKKWYEFNCIGLGSVRGRTGPTHDGLESST